MPHTPAPAWGTGEPIASVLFSPGSPLYRGALATAPFGPLNVPAQYTSPRDEFLAARSSAWLGVFLNTSPVYDVSGLDAVAFLNSVAVNRDFATFAAGASRHMLLCNDRGQLLADGLAVKLGDNHFRTYWLAPVLDFRLRSSDLDVRGEWILDEYFFQVDGPKSLEIFERVTGADLRELRFAHNTTITLGGGPATLHRLGMSGALAYEVHGHSSFALDAYEQLRAAVEAAGGAVQGFLNYALANHTVAGYPNQFQHFLYPYNESGPELAAYMAQVPQLDLGLAGSASDNRENAYVTPYDIGWGSLVDLSHDFPGKAALAQIAAAPPRRGHARQECRRHRRGLRAAVPWPGCGGVRRAPLRHVHTGGLLRSHHAHRCGGRGLGRADRGHCGTDDRLSGRSDDLPRLPGVGRRRRRRHRDCSVGACRRAASEDQGRGRPDAALSRRIPERDLPPRGSIPGLSPTTPRAGACGSAPLLGGAPSGLMDAVGVASAEDESGERGTSAPHATRRRGVTP